MSSERLWASGPGLVALFVVTGQVLWRAVVLSRGYFSQDDFLVMSAVHDVSWPDRLTVDYAGGFSPGGSVVAWLTVSSSPMSWGVAAATVLVLEAASTLMMWPVLTRLLGTRWLRVPILTLFAISTQTLWTTQWWVLGVEFWAATLCFLVAVWALLRAIQDDDTRMLGVVVGATVGALAFDERALLDPVVLAGVALVVQAGGTVRERAGRAVRDQLWVWAGLVAVLAAYGVLRWRVAPLHSKIGDELGDVVTAYLRHGLAEMFGGPWIGNLLAHAYLVPTSWVVALNGALLLALIGATLQRGGPAARASWGTLVVFVGASVGLLALAGQGSLIASLGLVHRFATELAPVFAICAAGALSAVDFGAFSLGRKQMLTAAWVERGIAGVAVVAVTASVAVSTAFLAPNLYHSDDRSYVANLRADLRAHPQVVLYDGGVPAGVVSPWYGRRASVSHVVGVASEHPVFDLPSHALRMVRSDGHLSPVVLRGTVVVTKTSNRPQCGYAVGANGVWVPMQTPVTFGRWVLRIGYYTATDGFMTVDVAGTSQRFPVRSGLNAVDLVVDGAFEGFEATLEAHDTALCLTNASAGTPRPETETS